MKGWDRHGTNWKRSGVTVSKAKTGYIATMPFDGKTILIGTTDGPDIMPFLERVSHFIDLKDQVYA